MHALIIEHHAVVAFAIEDALRDCGFTSCDFACTLEDAVAAAALRCPDLITSEMRLGAATGVDAVHAICRDKPIPVVFITAIAWEVYSQTLDAVVVQKPFRTEELKKAILEAKAKLPPVESQP